ncbi:TPA: carbohydrate ABC transporter permease [Klebsiella pneumoniae]|uniref:Lactose/L-arabinose transport system permease protein n=2 Tax=Gammaproteobacteria TaxID=1236 RepID=A0A841GF06_9GAMM|nr:MULTISPECIES: carbohydrate ABC transporter permease [Gammaproteobacteria]EBR1431349.1 carbohydrate ABC transporter permease [Salmonella enterica]EIY1307581.1 carbohydrate ABC transporter permease [Enterobacter hormaechei]EIY2678404.1 carbohydrate ABC transporter permease [Raoultella planticola]EKM0529261.1 carbohydrate ABC transporter permease [Cronobacter turicensis]ELP0887811.1 carbohydrate ABC transporter permease [Klebsiella oxytoca]
MTTSNFSRQKIYQGVMYLFLVVIAFVSLFPFFWMVVSSTNTTADINQGKMSFGTALIDNFTKLSQVVDLPQIFWNTTKVSLLGTFLTLVIASLAGYGFEIYQSKLRDKVYNLLLLTMMIPFAALMIPLFSMMAKANLLDTHWAVVLPSVASVYIIFYFRQCTKAFPKELLDAARVDGVKEWQIFVYVFFPVMRSTYAAAFIITFMANWNNFLWPLIVLQTPDMKTINLVLSSLSSAYVPDFGVVMIGTVAATLPTIAVFFAMQKQFVQGMVGSVK